MTRNPRQAGHQTPQDAASTSPAASNKSLTSPKTGRAGYREGKAAALMKKTGKGTCQTGDCAGLLQCRGLGGVRPATPFEMTLRTSNSALHYYDVSLIDGFNMPASMRPIGGSGCGVAACEADLNVGCLLALVVKKQDSVVGWKSACLAAKSDRYCCRGEFADPESCKTTIFGHLFKAICPRSYSYAFDDSTGLKICTAHRYVITFFSPKYG